MPDDIPTPTDSTSSWTPTPPEQELETLIENTSLDDVTIDTDALAAAVNEAPLPEENSTATTNKAPSIAGIEDISSYIEQKKQEQLKKPSSESLVAIDGTDLTKLNNVYAIVPHTKGDHKLVYFRNDVPKDVLDDEKGRKKGTTYIKNTVPIYDVFVDMKRHASLKGTDQQAFDVRVIDSAKDLDNQLEAIQRGKGGGGNFGIPIMIHPERAALAKKQEKQTQESPRTETATAQNDTQTTGEKKPVKKSDTKEKKTVSEKSNVPVTKTPVTKRKSSPKNIAETTGKKTATKELQQPKERSTQPSTKKEAGQKPTNSTTQETAWTESRSPSTEQSEKPEHRHDQTDTARTSEKETAEINENSIPLSTPGNTPIVSEEPQTIKENNSTTSESISSNDSSPSASEVQTIDNAATATSEHSVVNNEIADQEEKAQKTPASSSQADATTNKEEQNRTLSEDTTQSTPSEEEYSNRLSPFQDAPPLAEEAVPDFSLSENDLITEETPSEDQLSTPTASITEAPSSLTPDELKSQEEHHLFKQASQDISSERKQESSSLSEAPSAGIFHTPHQKQTEENSQPPIPETNDTPASAVPVPVPDVATPENIVSKSSIPAPSPEKSFADTDTEQMQKKNTESAPSEQPTETPASEHTVLDLDSLDLWAPPSQSSQSSVSTAPVSASTPKKTSAKKVPSASSLKSMSTALRIGGLVVFFWLSIIIRNIMFPASNESPSPTPAELETGDTLPMENPTPDEQPVPTPMPNEEIPTETDPSEEVPVDIQPIQESPKQQYTIPELIKKMEAQELDARRLLNKAKLLGNRDAIKFATAALLKASSTMEKAEKDTSVTADELQEDATRIDLYLQQASSILE